MEHQDELDKKFAAYMRENVPELNTEPAKDVVAAAPSKMAFELTEIFPALQAELEKVNERQIQRQSDDLDTIKENEKRLGVCHSQMAIRLYCLRKMMAAKAIEFDAKAKGADSDTEAKQFDGMSNRYKSLSEMANAAVWFEMRESTGCWDVDNIGIREGWMLVTWEDKEGEMPDFIKAIIRSLKSGGGMPPFSIG